MIARFGAFNVDSRTRTLTRAGHLLHLTPKALRLLELLVENRPDVVARERLIAHLWPGITVADGNLKNLIAEVRRALRDHGPIRRFIRTAHGYGYAFVHPAVDTAEAPVALSLEGDGKRRLLWSGMNLIGRGDDCSAIIDDSGVSGHHARILVTDRVTIEDLGSEQGTFVNGARLSLSAEVLSDLDEIRLGDCSFRVRFLRSLEWIADTTPLEARE